MPSHFAFRIISYIAGLLILAFGVAVSVNSGLGVSPVNSLPYVLSQISGVKLGSCVTAVFSFYVLLQILLLRKEFRLLDLTQVLFSTLFGFFVDFAKAVLGGWGIPTYAGRLVMLAVSMVLIAFGISLYVRANLVNMPMEGLTGAIAAICSGKSFHQMKVVVDTVVVVLSACLSLLFLGRLEGVREGTVLSALLIGFIMRPIGALLDRFFGKAGFSRAQES